MTCHTCANPTCVDDCQHYPPPALKVGSAEHKLQELLKIANQLVSDPLAYNGDRELMCHFCCGDYVHRFSGNDTIKHEPICPILKLEQFKQTLK